LPGLPDQKLDTSKCEFVVGFLDASVGGGAGCAMPSVGGLCCQLCQSLASGEYVPGYMSERRYWTLTIFMGESFTLQTEEYDDFLAEQTYFDDNSIVDVPMVGVYQGPQSIIEYFLVQNPIYTGFRHYIDPSVVADITLIESTETTIEYYYKATAPNFYINGAPFSELEAHFTATFAGPNDVLIDHLVVEFLERDVLAVANSFGSNVELCNDIMQTCSGRLAQFSCMSECLQYMNSLTLMQDGCPTLKGPTLACRWMHMYLAQPGLRPEVHCFHSGPELADPNGFVKCSIADCA